MGFKMIVDITNKIKYNTIKSNYIQIIQCICRSNISKYKIMLDDTGYNYCPKCHRKLKLIGGLRICEVV